MAPHSLDGRSFVLPDPLPWDRAEVYATLLTDAGGAAQTGDDPDSLIATAGAQFDTIPDDSIDNGHLMDAGSVLEDLLELLDDALARGDTHNGAAGTRLVVVDRRRVLVVAGGTEAEATIERADAYGFIDVLGITEVPNT